MAEPRSLTIRLPVPNVPGIIFVAVWGTLAVLFVVGELVTAPANDPGRFLAAGFLACGIVALGIAAYWLLRIPSVVVDGEAGTISVRPLGPVYRLERLQQINTWRVHTGDRAEKAIPVPCRYAWQVCLALDDGQEYRVWQGCSRGKARWLAQELCHATGKPWVGGREARQ